MVLGASEQSYGEISSGSVTRVGDTSDLKSVTVSHNLKERHASVDRTVYVPTMETRIKMGWK